MTIVTTIYRGTPARPRTEEITCFRAEDAHVHLAVTGTGVDIELFGANGDRCGMRLNTEEVKSFGSVLEASAGLQQASSAIARTSQRAEERAA